jgi:acyl-CoA thioester hydrolase
MRRFVLPFRVRYHECDAWGHVNNASYARYMQDAAFEASADAGFDMRWYAENNRIFVVRATSLNFLKPAHYGDQIEVHTWISDARRVTARRQYEIRSQTSGELFVSAHSDWVLVDMAGMRLASITPEMIAGLQPERTGDDAVKPEALVQAPQPAGVFSLERTVSFRDLDTERVVNNPVYLEYATDCGFDCSAYFGWGVQRMIDADTGIFFRNIHIEYLQPARIDERLKISAWLSDVKRVTAMRHFEMRRVSDDLPIARVNALCVCATLSSGAPARIPASLLADFAPNIAT